MRAGPPRVGQQHQREQAARFRFIRQQLHRQPRQPDRLGHQIGPQQRRRVGRRIPFVEDEIQHRQDRLDALRQLRARRHLVRNPRVPNLLLRPHQPLRRRRLPAPRTPAQSRASSSRRACGGRACSALPVTARDDSRRTAAAADRPRCPTDSRHSAPRPPRRLDADADPRDPPLTVVSKSSGRLVVRLRRMRSSAIRRETVFSHAPG